MEIKTEVNYKGLKKLIEAMSKQYQLKVGLLASKAGINGKKGSDQVRGSENIDLAGLGAVHEFGATINVTDKMRGFFRHTFGINIKKTTTQIQIPPRSFLKGSLIKDNGAGLRKKLAEKYGADSESILDYVTESGDLMSLAILLGASALEQIQEAFDTGGFGEWTPDSQMTIAQKGSAMPLVDKGDLRGAITYEVNNNG